MRARKMKVKCREVIQWKGRKQKIMNNTQKMVKSKRKKTIIDRER